MRNLILLAIGLVAGAIGAASVINALRQRDAYPRGLMDVMQYHYSAMRDELRNNRCSEAPSHIAALRMLYGDIESAMYQEGSADAPFVEYDRRLGDALEAASTAGTECRALAPAVERVTAACDACHHQYR